MNIGYIFLALLFVGFFIMIYFAIKIEIERCKKINALSDEMYLYFKKLNNKEF